MQEELTGFEACKQCYTELNPETINIRLCRESSNTCPPIPEELSDTQAIEYLIKGVANIGKSDMVDHPLHYNNHPSGIECIDVTEHMSFNVGNAVKYLWRVDDKDNPFQDLDKALWYIKREIEKRKKNG